MPRFLAIDWDRNEVRALLISSGATGTSVAGAWSASLVTAEPAGLTGKQIGARLAAATGGQISGKVTTLVGVGRDNVQIKLLSLPPAPPEELPVPPPLLTFAHPPMDSAVNAVNAETAANRGQGRRSRRAVGC